MRLQCTHDLQTLQGHGTQSACKLSEWPHFMSLEQKKWCHVIVHTRADEEKGMLETASCPRSYFKAWPTGLANIFKIGRRAVQQYSTCICSSWSGPDSDVWPLAHLSRCLPQDRQKCHTVSDHAKPTAFVWQDRLLELTYDEHPDICNLMRWYTTVVATQRHMWWSFNAFLQIVLLTFHHRERGPHQHVLQDKNDSEWSLHLRFLVRIQSFNRRHLPLTYHGSERRVSRKTCSEIAPSTWCNTQSSACILDTVTSWS